MAGVFTLPPAVIIHGARHLQRAIASGRTFTLLSAPGAASYAGCHWWRCLVADSVMPNILDCADAPGRALEALRLGQKIIVLAPDTPGFAQIVAASGIIGARVLPAAPAALDLNDRGSDARLMAWLGLPHQPKLNGCSV